MRETLKDKKTKRGILAFVIIAPQFHYQMSLKGSSSDAGRDRKGVDSAKEKSVIKKGKERKKAGDD